MERLFRVAWGDLDVAAITAFLDEADDEGLLWEAKGGGLQPKPGSSSHSPRARGLERVPLADSQGRLLRRHGGDRRLPVRPLLPSLTHRGRAP